MAKDRLSGTYRFEDSHFVAVGEMAEIIQCRSRMKLLADIGNGVSSVFMDPDDGTLWSYEQGENYETTFTRVTREWILAHHPTFDPDRPLPPGERPSNHPGG